MNNNRRGPSGCFMAIIGICALALIVLIIYGVAVSNPDLVKQIMGIEPTPAPGYEEGMYMDDMFGADMYMGDMYGEDIYMGDMYAEDVGESGAYYEDAAANNIAMG